jgi:hypothetical protein
MSDAQNARSSKYEEYIKDYMKWQLAKIYNHKEPPKTTAGAH